MVLYYLKNKIAPILTGFRLAPVQVTKEIVLNIYFESNCENYPNA